MKPETPLPPASPPRTLTEKLMNIALLIFLGAVIFGCIKSIIENDGFKAEPWESVDRGPSR